MSQFKRIFSLALVFLLLFSFIAEIPAEAATASAKQPATNTLIIHYKRPANDYTDWSLWIWEKGKDGKEYKFTKKDSFGRVAEIKLDAGITEVGILVKRGNWLEKDIQDDRYITIKKGTNSYWLLQSDKTIYTALKAVPAKAPVILTKNVTFKYYSSSAKQVSLNCSYNNWATDKLVTMKKQGNWFTVTVPVIDKSNYRFLVDTRWINDPLNTDRRYIDQAQINFKNVPNETNITTSVSIYTSTNFDYFTTNGIDKTPDLEGIYSKLTTKLKPFTPHKELPKIYYYAIGYLGDSHPYCANSISEIYDLWDCNSSHEIIHALVMPENIGFAEGMATCYQVEGNQTMKEQNPNLICNQLVLNGDIDLISIINSSVTAEPQTYTEMASFVYYNIFVMNKTTDFAKFLAALKSTDNLDQIKKHYKAFMGLELEVSIQNWKDWLLTITQDSNIYVNWD